MLKIVGGLIWEYLKGNYGNIASVVGLLITYRVYRDVKKLRRRYIFIGRSDDLVNRLREHTQELTECLNDFAGSPSRVTAQVKLITATLELMEDVTVPPQQKSVRQLLHRVRRYSIDAGPLDGLPLVATRSGEKGLRAIHDELLYMTQRIVDAQENLKYE